MDPVVALKRALGLVLATKRTDAGLSQQALALQAGVTTAYLGRLERGTTKIVSLEILEAIAAPLETLPEELLAHARARRAEISDHVEIVRPNVRRGRPRKDSV